MRACPRHVPLGDRKLIKFAPNPYIMCNTKFFAMSPTPAMRYPMACQKPEGSGLRPS